MYYTKKERLEIVLDIAKKLKNFKCKNGEIMNLYDDCYSFIIEFKKICNDYVNQEDDKVIEYKGELEFEEIGKRIEYMFPAKNKKPLFVIRGNKHI